MSPWSESDTRAKLIDPGLHGCGWTEDLIRREETAGAVEIIDGQPRRRARGRVDYVLRVKVSEGSQPVAVALIEAKAENLPPGHGLEQAKAYGACARLNVAFVFSSNGHQFVEFDRARGITSAARPLGEFPSPAELRARYEKAMGFSLDAPSARPLVTRYAGGEEGTRRYYQDAAVRAVLEKLASGETRALLSLATGAGKTRIAVNLLRRIADAGQLHRALFVCDRDELRSQGLGAFQNVFGADAAPVSGSNPQKNARVLVATYQTLDVDSEEADANFLTTHYPENYFSHIIIDECHRSAWGKWSRVLTRNPGAVQIGLTATPRTLEITERTREALADAKVSADNRAHFGPPVYEYDMSQGIEDGYLAACEILRRDIFLDDKARPDRESGVDQDDLRDKTLRDADTGAPVGWVTTRMRYEASAFEDRLLLPERVTAMARDLFQHFLATGGPEQKTIIFCARDRHADDVAAALNNLYAGWCAEQGRTRAEPYAFKCTAARGAGVPGRPARRLPPPLRRDHRGPAHHRRGRALRAEHRLLQVRALTDLLLSDGGARDPHRPRHRQADVSRLRLHRRDATLRGGVQDALRAAAQGTPVTWWRGAGAAARADDPGGGLRRARERRRALHRHHGGRPGHAGDGRGVQGASGRAPRRRGADDRPVPLVLDHSGGAP